MAVCVGFGLVREEVAVIFVDVIMVRVRDARVWSIPVLGCGGRYR